MPTLKAALKNNFKNAKKLAILGIGSELRADDAAGMAIAKKLQEYSRKKKKKTLRVFLGETAPENLTGEIKKFQPSHVLIIDAIDLRRKAGAAAVIDISEESGESFSTHKMPVKILVDYLEKSIGCKVTVLGVQPKVMEFGSPVSHCVERAAEDIAGELKEIIEQMGL